LSVAILSASVLLFFFFFSSRRRHTRCYRDWSSDVCSSDLTAPARSTVEPRPGLRVDRAGAVVHLEEPCETRRELRVGGLGVQAYAGGHLHVVAHRREVRQHLVVGAAVRGDGLSKAPPLDPAAGPALGGARLRGGVGRGVAGPD